MTRIESSDLIRLCAEVYHFSRKADLRWKGLPVLTWEFARERDYYDTRAIIMQALSPDMVTTMMARGGGSESESFEQIDCHGVTFRLVLKR